MDWLSAFVVLPLAPAGAVAWGAWVAAPLAGRGAGLADAVVHLYSLATLTLATLAHFSALRSTARRAARLHQRALKVCGDHMGWILAGQSSRTPTNPRGL